MRERTQCSYINVAFSWWDVNKKMSIVKRSCVSIPVNWFWSQSNLCTKRSETHHVTGRNEENNERVLEFNVSPTIALINKLCLVKNSTQSRMSSSSSSISNCCWLAYCSERIVKIDKYFATLFLASLHIQSLHLAPWTNSRFSICFCIKSYYG